MEDNKVKDIEIWNKDKVSRVDQALFFYARVMLTHRKYTQSGLKGLMRGQNKQQQIHTPLKITTKHAARNLVDGENLSVNMIIIPNSFQVNLFLYYIKNAENIIEYKMNATGTAWYNENAADGYCIVIGYSACIVTIGFSIQIYTIL